jgi:hypothetical protein
MRWSGALVVRNPTGALFVRPGQRVYLHHWHKIGVISAWRGDGWPLNRAERTPPSLGFSPRCFPVRATDRRARNKRITYDSAMAISPRWYRENANACAWRAEQSRNPLAKAAYKEIVRAWLILAVSAEELVRYPPREARTEEQSLAA